MRMITLPPRPEPDPLSDPLSLAVVAEICEHGYPHTTARQVAARAGITPAEFERLFGDLDQCALDTYERLIAAFKRRVGGAFNRHLDWRTAVRAAGYEAADWLEENPQTATFAMTESLRMRNELAKVRREELFAFCAEIIEQGLVVAADPKQVPEGASILAAGSIMQLLTHRLLEGAEVHYHEGARESLYGIIRMYLGEEAAREELSLPRPAREARCQEQAGGEPRLERPAKASA